MIKFCAKTDIGLKRKKNDDFFLCVNDPSQSVDIKHMGRMFAVADGMGGHPAGDMASRIACETLKKSYYDVSGPAGLLYAGASTLSCQPVLKRLRQAFEEADKKICIFECNNKRCEGLGTTLSALVIRGKQFVIAHVGDSRIYRLREHGLELLTRDHTFVQDLVDMGDLSLEEARKDPMRHILMQAVGQGFESVYTRCGSVRSGDIFLLCSDGLHDMVADDTIKEILEMDISLDDICSMLVKRAIEEGGRDNITVVVVSFQEQERGNHV